MKWKKYKYVAGWLIAIGLIVAIIASVSYPEGSKLIAFLSYACVTVFLGLILWGFGDIVESLQDLYFLQDKSNDFYKKYLKEERTAKEAKANQEK